MDPDAHAARYLGFMRSVAYVPDHDLVAAAPDGRVAAFTVYWPDTELSLAQFEPVGTDPDFQRLGLGRAVLLDALRRLEHSGIAHARVMTNGDNHAAIASTSRAGSSASTRSSTGTARHLGDRGYVPVRAATRGAKSRAFSPGITWYE